MLSPLCLAPSLKGDFRFAEELAGGHNLCFAMVCREVAFVTCDEEIGTRCLGALEEAIVGVIGRKRESSDGFDAQRDGREKFHGSLDSECMKSELRASQDFLVFSENRRRNRDVQSQSLDEIDQFCFVA